MIQYRETPDLSQGRSVEDLNLGKVTEIEVDECPDREQYQEH